MTKKDLFRFVGAETIVLDENHDSPIFDVKPANGKMEQGVDKPKIETLDDKVIEVKEDNEGNRFDKRCRVRPTVAGVIKI